jgi:hypothetical protein
MLLAPSQRIKPGPLRQALGDSVQELDHSLQSLKFTSSTRSKAGTDLHKLARLSPSHEPAKPASPKFWQSHLKTAAGHGRGLAIAYDKVQHVFCFCSCHAALPLLMLGAFAAL